MKTLKTLALAIVIVSFIPTGVFGASAPRLYPGYRIKETAPTWQGSDSLKRVALNAQAWQYFELNKELQVGALAPVDPANGNIIYLFSVSYPNEGLANYNIYTYHLKRGTLWPFMVARLSNVTEVEERGLEPLGFVGNNLVFRKITDDKLYFPCNVSLSWYLYAERYNLVAVDVRAKVKKIKPFILPANIVAAGQKDERACRDGQTGADFNWEDGTNSGNTGVGVSPDGLTTIAGCATNLPANPWNAKLTGKKKRAESDSWVANVGADKNLRVGFGSDAATGIPYNVVGAGANWSPIRFVGPGRAFSSAGPYPIPDNALIEAGNPRRLLILDRETCYYYEMLNARRDGLTNTWLTDLGAVFYFKAEWLRPQKWPAATASGIALLPGIVKYDEVSAGVIRHPLLFTAPQAQKKFIAPATAGSGIDDGSLPAFGARYRLKSDFDTARLPAQARVIAEALKTYGMLFADYGEPWTILGTPDPRWNDKDLAALARIPGAAFEVVDSGEFVRIWFE